MAAQGRRTGQGGTGDITEQIVPGAIAGVAAWIVGFVLTIVLAIAIGIGENGGGGGGGDVGSLLGEAAVWKGAGMLFHAAHFVSIEAMGFSVNPITMQGGAWYILLIAPPLALIGAGYFAASRAGVRDPTNGAKAGAMVIAGYLPLALIGAFLFQLSFSAMGTSISVGPSLVMSALVMGIVYPAIFGAVGGYLGSS